MAIPPSEHKTKWPCPTGLRTICPSVVPQNVKILFIPVDHHRTLCDAGQGRVGNISPTFHLWSKPHRYQFLLVIIGFDQSRRPIESENGRNVVCELTLRTSELTFYSA